MISDLLPRYQEAHEEMVIGDNYKILESWMVAGREVAWAEVTTFAAGWYDGRFTVSRPFVFRRLVCEDEFREGKGWKRKKDGNIDHYSVDNCRHIETVVKRQYAKLKAEYAREYASQGGLNGNQEVIILDLIRRLKQGEMIDGGWANNQNQLIGTRVLSVIFGESGFWDAVDRLDQQGYLSREIFVIDPPKKRQRLRWQEVLRVDGEKEGVVGIAYYRQVGGRALANWKLEMRQDGKVVGSPALFLNSQVFEPVEVPSSYDVTLMRHQLEWHVRRDT